MMLGDMMDTDAGWKLRKTLQTEPRIILVGSATSRFAEIDRPDQALYDLFRVITRDHPAFPGHERVQSALEINRVRLFCDDRREGRLILLKLRQ